MSIAKQKYDSIKLTDRRVVEISHRASHLLDSYVQLVDRLCYRYGWVLEDKSRNNQTLFCGTQSEYVATRMIQYDPYSVTGVNKHMYCKVSLYTELDGKAKKVLVSSYKSGKGFTLKTGASLACASNRYLHRAEGVSTYDEDYLDVFEFDADELDNLEVLTAKVNAAFIRTLRANNIEPSFRSMNMYDFSEYIMQKLFVEPDVKQKRYFGDITGVWTSTITNPDPNSNEPNIVINYQMDAELPCKAITVPISEYVKKTLAYAPDGVELLGAVKPRKYVKGKTNTFGVVNTPNFNLAFKEQKREGTLPVSNPTETLGRQEAGKKADDDNYETIFDWS